MSENRYACPYCGKTIEKKDVLFWEKVKTQYTDRIRGDFLRTHGVNASSGNKFPRLYYRVREDEKGSNVIRTDGNGFPTAIEDHPGNAIAPENLGQAGGTAEDSFDEDFDSDGFDNGSERAAEQQNRELRTIPMRACPYCHCELPQQFGVLKTYHVAMFGGRAAGKTSYLVNLFQQLDVQLMVNDLGSVDLAAESEQFLRPLIEEYEETGTTRPTPADSGLLPIVCHYKRGAQEAFINFYDIAGEGTDDAAYMANHQGIANSEALMLMVDPNMLNGGAFYSEWMANHAQGEDRFSGNLECCREPLDRFLNLAGELCREYSERIRYIVCVVTKVDMLLEKDAQYFGAGDIELLTDVGEKHRDAVSLPVLKRINDNLKIYLAKQHRVDLKKKLTDTFGADVQVSVLGVSTSTRIFSGGSGIHFEPRSSATEPKHRIVEPFLMVLMYFGLIPARNDAGEIKYYHDRKREPEPVPEPAPAPEPKKKKRGLFHWGR